MVPVPIVAITTYAPNVMETIGDSLAGVTDRRCLLVENQQETERRSPLARAVTRKIL